MGDGDSAMIMRMDGQTTPLTRFENDLPRLRTAIDEMEPSDTPADLRRAPSAPPTAARAQPADGDPGRRRRPNSQALAGPHRRGPGPG
jgi:hypothetical protein